MILFHSTLRFSNPFYSSLLLSLFYLLVCLCHAQDEEPEPSPTEGPIPFQDWQKGRIHYWSNKSPLAKIVQKSTPLIQDMIQITDHISRFEKRILKDLREQNPPQSHSNIKPCNFEQGEQWLGSATAFVAGHGFGDLDTSCVSQYSGTKLDGHDKVEMKTEQLYTTIANRGKILYELGNDNKQEIAWNFTTEEIDLVHNFEYKTASQKCTLHSIAAIRLNQSWHIVTSFTYGQKEKQLEDFQRQSVAEMHRIESDKVIAAIMLARKGPYYNDSEGDYDDATTVIETWKGGLQASHILGVPFDQNPAIVEALEKGDLNVQQASDAVSPSSIAILFLPLGLNLVPIALLAPVNALTTLLYTLMSDVLTVFPLAIKGIELINIGNEKVPAISTRISSSLEGNIAKNALAELWAAECTAGSDVKVQGIIFLTLAIIFLVFGVAAEIIARHYALKRRNRRLSTYLPKHMGDSGHASDHSQEFGLQSGQLDDLDPSYDPPFAEEGKANYNM